MGSTEGLSSLGCGAGGAIPSPAPGTWASGRATDASSAPSIVVANGRLPPSDDDAGKTSDFSVSSAATITGATGSPPAPGFACSVISLIVAPAGASPSRAAYVAVAGWSANPI